jgi:hypothetical protein
MPVTVNIDPDGRRAVEILSALRIDEVGTFALVDDQGLLLLPFLHLRKRMPQIGMVPGGKWKALGWSSHDDRRIQNNSCGTIASTTQNPAPRADYNGGRFL